MRRDPLPTRLEADELKGMNMAEKFNEDEARKVLEEVYTKRYAPDVEKVDKSGWKSKDHLQHTADKLTVDDWEKVSGVIWNGMSDLQKQLLSLYIDINDEFTRGMRCSVCGHTPNQAKALNYDCAREC